MPDYEAFLDAIYDALGIEASIDALDVTLTITDKTDGAVLDGTIAAVHFGTMKPAACVRVSELDDKEIAREDLAGQVISFGGNDWTISSTQPKPKPGSKGELILFLQNS